MVMRGLIDLRVGSKRAGEKRAGEDRADEVVVGVDGCSTTGEGDRVGT